MTQYFRPAAVMFLLFTLLTGVIYPILVTLTAQLLFTDQANGSLIKDNNDNLIGSTLIGQSFAAPKYFWGRPSATAPYPYNAAASSGSNLGPSNPALFEGLAARVQALKNIDPGNTAPLPIDLVTASGSGLDPHISPAAAKFQIHRIAKIRKLNESKLQDLVAAHTEQRQWFVLGEPRVNVLTLNLALEQIQR